MLCTLSRFRSRLAQTAELRHRSFTFASCFSNALSRAVCSCLHCLQWRGRWGCAGVTSPEDAVSPRSHSGGGNSHSSPKMPLRTQAPLGEFLSCRTTVCTGQQSYCRPAELFTGQQSCLLASRVIYLPAELFICQHFALPSLAEGAWGRMGRAESAGSARDGPGTPGRNPNTQNGAGAAPRLPQLDRSPLPALQPAPSPACFSSEPSMAPWEC